MALTEKQRELKGLHGTPNEFRIALRRAVDDLMVTPDEATQAFEEYLREWEAAGKPGGTSSAGHGEGSKPCRQR